MKRVSWVVTIVMCVLSFLIGAWLAPPISLKWIFIAVAFVAGLAVGKFIKK